MSTLNGGGNSPAVSYFRVLGSLLYNEPSAEAIDMLIDEKVLSVLPYASDNERALKGQKELLEWLESSPREDLTLEARTEYMRLLIGIGKSLAPPWGSTYLNDDRLLFTEETLKVRFFYEKYGMKLKEKYSEPDDHIGLELEFLAYLLERGEREAACTFAAQFLVPWISRWNADMQKHSKTGYYKGLGNMALGGIDFFISAR
ncbi:MAG: molecular chaperone TorD family protein [Deferribacteraceae bacterium]|jgi:TorA maturation chaperone TorD|nr:molecular chaperone TorD family protein [Deferribacteraceae bacterium]